MSTIPTRISEPGGGAAAVGKSVIVKGQIFSREDLYVDGEVEGSIEVQEHRLTVGPNGKVHANVIAREIIVQGTVHGNMEAGDKIEIRKEAKLVGDIITSRIVIEDGAYFKGSIDIARQETPKPAPAPRPAMTPPPPRPEPARTSVAGVEHKP
ncbi:MAG: polymer-forming cytoskeletal protein [Bryobacteraceae bacterium]|nr:polymer-forming cytoskeletal protein [Bryobacteraceae bacterium]